MADNDELPEETEESTTPSTASMVRAFIPDRELAKLHEWMTDCILPVEDKPDAVQYMIDIDEAEFDFSVNEATLIITVLKFVTKDLFVTWSGEGEFKFNPDVEGSGFLFRCFLGEDSFDDENKDLVKAARKYISENERGDHFIELTKEELDAVIKEQEAQSASALVQSLPPVPSDELQPPASSSAALLKSTYEQEAIAEQSAERMLQRAAKISAKFIPIKGRFKQIVTGGIAYPSSSVMTLTFTTDPMYTGRTDGTGGWLVKAGENGRSTLVADTLEQSVSDPNLVRLVMNLPYHQSHFGRDILPGETIVYIRLSDPSQLNELNLPTFTG